MEKFGEELINTTFTDYYQNNFGKCAYNKEKQIGICEALEPYIPIDQFMKLFEHNGEMIKKYNLKAFVFDKRALRAFHQPSMEWYFIEWKQDMLKLGLKDHYKILPNEDWFKKCVEAGKAEILEAYPQHQLDELNITYVDSIQEAIDHHQSHKLVTTS